MLNLRLDAKNILCKHSGTTVADTYDGYYYDKEGYIKVIKYIKEEKLVLYNFVNAVGEEVSSKWFKECSSFNNGFSIVILTDGSKNVLTYDGNLLLRENNKYESIEFFSQYFFKATDVKGNVCLISTEGKQLKGQWYDKLDTISVDKNKMSNFILVNRNCKFNILDQNGNYIFEKFFINYEQVHNILVVSYRTKNPIVKKFLFMNLITGEIIHTNKYVHMSVDSEHGCFIIMDSEGLVNILRTDGTYIFEKWYSLIQIYDVGKFICIRVYENIENSNKLVSTLYNMQGENLVNKMWFDQMSILNFPEYTAIQLIKEDKTYIYNFKTKVLHLEPQY